MDVVIIIVLVAALSLLAYSAGVRQMQAKTMQVRLQAQIAQNDRKIAEQSRQLEEIQSQFSEVESKHTTESLLAHILSDAAYDLLIIVNAQSEILALNTVAQELFGAVVEVGRPISAITDAPELQMMVHDALANATETFEEQINIRGQFYRTKVAVVVHDNQQFITLVLQNITQLVRLNRARRDMVANISHELRTPIANIRLIIDALFHEQEKPKRKESISSLRAIARETDNLLWLVQEMSDLSMIESGQAIVRLVEVHLAELVDEAIERMEDQSAFKDVKLVRHIPELLHVLCDRDLAQRVLVNLIHNAIKWSPKGEAVTISAHNGSDEVTISVLDNGPGVPDDQVDRIFERFYQVDASRSGNDGTGLGLAICRHIVEAHGGRIWAESNKDGGGGRFLFTLLSAGEHQPEHLDWDEPDVVEVVESNDIDAPEAD